MMENDNKNSQLISDGFRLTLNVLAPYVASELRLEFGDDWWRQGVYSRLFPDQTNDYPANGTDEDLIKAFDIKLALQTVDLNWPVFRKRCSPACRSWVNELKVFRNRWAHQKQGDVFSDSDTARALEDLSLICGEIGSVDARAALDEMVRIIRYGDAKGSIAGQPKKVVIVKKAGTSVMPAAPSSGLKPWREVMAPHQDVAAGLYRNAEFAADLAQVVNGKASAEYRDPVEFFNRTFLTSGMSALMKQALLRVSGKGGEPVVELKTAFGGGKTHTMLALYHLLNEKGITARVPRLDPIVKDAGLDDIPETHVAVFVGTAVNSASFRRPADMPGIQINTMWGEIAYQIAKSCGNPKLYDYVKDADKKGISPGSDALSALFDKAGSCLILVDELVAYGRQLVGKTDLPAGTFDTFLTFIQALTEAASASPRTMLVVSIPESDNEIGGDYGQKTLDCLNHYFGRKEAIWKPVASNEGFEIVRRRLFSQCVDDAARDETCEAFGAMYRNHSSDFPVDCKEEDYVKRMKACYPIHPEVFDRLYDDWSTLDKFQRTRGVLRLMAAVINKLWESGDQNPMIMPSSIPVGSGAVKEELLRYLSPEWNSIVDLEVDGPKSQPFQIDRGNSLFGRYQSARKVARTLFFGSAPSMGQQNRGLEKSQVLLGCVQPGESIPVYSDTLSVLLTRLSYLYNVNMDHFWYDTRPTLRKLMEDRANRISDDKANEEIVKKLCHLSKGFMFSEIHVAPTSSLDIPELESARLVVLPPTVSYNSSDDGTSSALAMVSDYIQNHGSAPRQYKNTLLFCFADSRQLYGLRLDAKKYLAWRSIDGEKDSQSYMKADLVTIQEGLVRSEEDVNAKVNDTYCWVITPRMRNLKDLELKPVQLGGSDSVILRAEKMLEQNEDVIGVYSPALLVMVLEKYYWIDRNDIQIKELWKAFCSYCYMPRIKSYQVFENTIVKGVEGDEYFGLAEGIADGGYLGLKFNEPVGVIDRSNYLVKCGIAKAQKEKRQAAVQPGPQPDLSPSSNPDEKVSVTPARPSPFTINPIPGPAPVIPVQPTPTKFYLTVKLDKSRATRDFGRLMDEVVSQLVDVQGSSCEIKVEIDAVFPPGKLNQAKQRTIEENCKVLKVDDSGFDNK